MILRPVESASMTKSIDQVRLGAAGRSSGRRSVASFTTSSAFYAQATEVIKPVHALMINMKPFTAQQLPNTTVAKTPALQCQLSDAPDKCASAAGR
ncbi:hypothetical protein GR02_19500 [Escherichia coli]|nr:hypothetical protein GR02_19500 [Escherichia coli]